VNLLTDALSWLTDPAQWSGPTGIPTRTLEQLRYSAAALVVAGLLALPVGLWLGHLRRFGQLAINVGNVGRAVPSFAVILLASQIWAIEEWPVVGPVSLFLALTLLAIPPMLINAYTGMSEISDDLREAARGMGFSGTGQALRVELPNSLPLVLAGIRISTLQVVATATLGAVVGAGGLGRYIVDGLAVRDNARVLGGAILVAALALIIEGLLAVLQRIAVSPGVRRAEVARPAGRLSGSTSSAS
jgi:osmoprotectant transport system permease protein